MTIYDKIYDLVLDNFGGCPSEEHKKNRCPDEMDCKECNRARTTAAIEVLVAGVTTLKEGDVCPNCGLKIFDVDKHSKWCKEKKV